MTAPSSRETEYVVVRQRKPKKPVRYYYDDDDDDDDDDDEYLDDIHSHRGGETIRRVVRRKPVREQRIRYVTSEHPDPPYQPNQTTEQPERTIKVKRTTNGEQVLLDEDDNIIKVIRNGRSPTPPPIEHRRIRIRPREPRVQYYEASDGHLVARAPKKHIVIRPKDDLVYADDEPTKMIRKIVIDPSAADANPVYEREKVKKPTKKYVIRQRASEVPADSDDVDEHQHHHSEPQYVRVVQRPAAAPQAVAKKEPTTKYVMVRKKADSEPVYAVTSSVPVMKNNRRIVYETPTRDATTKYVYSTDGKFYK